MSDEFNVEKNEQAQTNEQQTNEQQTNKVIDEANYKIRAPRESGPSAIGRGGDPLFKRIRATKEQLLELMEETQTVQDWIQRETSNNVALACLNNENLKDIYYEIKDGFECADKKYGKISLMGYKTPRGVEIPRLKIYDTNGEVIEVLTGPFAIEELNKRALAYKESSKNYETVQAADAQESEIEEYSGNIEDYAN